MREILESYSRILVSTWTYSWPGTRTIRPDRISEDIDPTHLDQIGRMSDIRDVYTRIMRLWGYDRDDLLFFPSDFLPM
jgi:hypothetical protein